MTASTVDVATTSQPARSKPYPVGGTARPEDETRELFATLATADEDDPQRSSARDRLIETYLPFARYVARRYADRGEPLDDLVQVATVGLIKAVDGYDMARGTEFLTYASPTIVGELKRYFRDKGWTVRVPRYLQELRAEVNRIRGDLTQRLGHSPTVPDIAQELAVDQDDVLHALEAGNAYAPLSLNAPAAGEEDAGEIGDLLGAPDPRVENAADRVALGPALARLPTREQRILALRFAENMTQTQIAERIGISQMHVSRLIARSIATLRAQLVTV